MRLSALGLCVFIFLGACTAKAEQDGGGPIQIAAEPIALNPQVPGQVQIGAFTYVGGLALTSPGNPRFGGLSDLVVTGAGDLIAVTDEGSLVRARLSFDANNQIAGIGSGRLAPLSDRLGKSLLDKDKADAEGLVVLPNGDLMVSFEHDHRIWIYPASGRPPQPVPMPDIPMPPNDGMEGLSLAPAQGVDAYWVGVEAGPIWLCHIKTDCKAHANLPMPPSGFRLTGLRESPDGQLFILHHRWTKAEGSRIVLNLVFDPAGQTPRIGQSLTLESPLNTDNFEGIAVTKTKTGTLRVYLLSDDNFSKTQRSLLMAFELTTPARP